jgi:hypothetical protein
VTFLLPVIIRPAAGARCSARTLPRQTEARLVRPRKTRASGAAPGRPRSRRRQPSQQTRLLRLLQLGGDVRPARGVAEGARLPPPPEIAPRPRPLPRQSPPAARHPLQGPMAEERPGSSCAGHRLTCLGRGGTLGSTHFQRLLGTPCIADQPTRRPSPAQRLARPAALRFDFFRHPCISTALGYFGTLLFFYFSFSLFCFTCTSAGRIIPRSANAHRTHRIPKTARRERKAVQYRHTGRETRAAPMGVLQVYPSGSPAHDFFS